MPVFPTPSSAMTVKQQEQQWTFAAEELQQISDAQLLAYLMEAYRRARVSTPSSPVLSQAFIHSLLTCRYLTSPVDGVAQLAGCLLCDAIRCGGSVDCIRSLTPNDTTTATTALPFPSPSPSSVLMSVLRTILQPFEAVVQYGQPLQRCEYIIERASASRVFLHLLPPLQLETENAAEINRLLQTLFEAAAGTKRKDFLQRGSEVKDTAIASSTVAEMASLLTDILHVSNSITVEQLRPLLSEIVAASPALQNGAAAGAATSHRGTSGKQQQQLPATLPSSAQIARRVFLQELDTLQPAIATWAIDEFECGVAEVTAAVLLQTEAAGSGGSKESNDAVQEQRLRGLKSLARVMEALVALMELHVDLAAALVSLMTPHISHEHTDVRLLALRGFLSAFASNSAAVNAYPAAFEALLERFLDIKPNIRMELLQQAPQLVRSSASALATATAATAALARQSLLTIWKSIHSYLEKALTDPHVPTRRQAVYCIMEVALAASALFPASSSGADDTTPAQPTTPTPIGGGGVSCSMVLHHSLGLRTRDKNKRIRDAAVESLMTIYLQCGYSWIPNAIVDAVPSEGGVRVVEAILDQLFPPAAATTLSERQTTLLKPTSDVRQAVALPLFDFEMVEASEEAAGLQMEPRLLDPAEISSGKAAITASASSAAVAAAALVETFQKFCAHLDPPHLRQLLTVARKKPQLRLTISKLYELRAAVKEIDTRAAQGQQVVNNIHRLLQFLQELTGATKGEWDRLFRTKDDAIGKAFMRVCSPTLTDWRSARGHLLQSLQGRIPTEELTFVKTSLLPQMMLPIGPEHIVGLQVKLRRCLAQARRGDDPCGATAAVMTGALRSLLVVGVSCPASLAICGADLVAALRIASQHPVAMESWGLLLMEVLQQWTLSVPKNDSGADRPLNHTDACEILQMLEGICLAQAAPPCYSAKRGKLAAQAAKTILSFKQVAVLQEASVRSVTSLVTALRASLRGGRTLVQESKAVSWLGTLSAIAKDRQAATLLHGNSKNTEGDTADLLSSLSELLLAAAVDNSDAKREVTRVRPPVVAAVPFPAAAAETVLNPSMPAVVDVECSTAAMLVKGVAKCVTAMALSCPVVSKPHATSSAMEMLLLAYKSTTSVRHRMASSIGSQQRRLAIEKQLVRLLISPTADIRRELACAVVLSVEEDSQVRYAVQQKLTSYLLRQVCDMRVAALLILTAVSEETKQSYQQLRSLIESVGHHLRTRQTAQGMSLSAPNALFAFLEYAIPFLVLYMAHHPHFNAEDMAATHLIAFQRVWHLLFDELLRLGTQCASFVVELFNKIKQSSDVLDPRSNATRVFCDLGTQVLLACLSQRQSSAEDLRRYPGAILLPSFFTPAASPDQQQLLLRTAYLPESLHICTNVPFRLPTSVQTAGVGSGSLANSLRPTPRPSASRARDDIEGEEGYAEEEEAAEVQAALSPAHTTAAPPQRRMKRSRSTAAECPSVQREGTQPAVAEREAEPLFSAARLQRRRTHEQAVNAALDELFDGMTRDQLAEVRWKFVRSRVAEVLKSTPTPAAETAPLLKTLTAAEEAEDMEALLQFAKDQLRERYERAPCTG